MNRILMNSIIAVAAIILLFQSFVFDKQSIIYPLVVLFLISLSFVNQYITRKKIENGDFFQIGINKSPFRSSIYWLVLGVFWIIFGIVDKHSVLSWNGIDFKIFIGIMMFSNVYSQYNKFELLLKSDSIIFSGWRNGGIWRNSKITKVLINNNNVTFFKKGMRRTFTFEDNDILIVKKYFSEKMNNKLVIE